MATVSPPTTTADEIQPVSLSHPPSSHEHTQPNYDHTPRESTPADSTLTSQQTTQPSKRKSITSKSKSKSYPSRPWSKLRDNMTLLLYTRHIRPYADHVLSATSINPVPPHEPSVAGVIAALQKGGNTADRATPVGAVLCLLRERLKHPSWQVVLKTLILVHAIIRGGNQRFVDHFASVPKDSFDRDEFKDKKAGGDVHSHIIRAYATYLKMWFKMRTKANFPQTTVTDPLVVNRFKASNAQDLLAALPHVLDYMESLKQMPLNEKVLESKVFQPGILMILDDMVRTFTALSAAVERLMDRYFFMVPEQAVAAFALYQRVLKVDGEVREIVETMRKVDERWKIPERRFTGEVLKEMKQYIDGGCEHVEETEYEMVVRTATKADDAAAREEEVGAVLKWVHDGDVRDPSTPVGAVLKALEGRIRSRDWRVVLKAMGVMRRLMSGANQEMMEFLAYNGVQWLDGIESNVGEGIHVGLVSWMAEFLRIRVKVLHAAAFTSGGSTVEKIIRSLPRGLDVLQVMQRMYVHEELRGGVVDGVYELVLDDLFRVFAAVVRKANDLVGRFFELPWKMADVGLMVYERFVGVVRECDGSGGVFEKAKLVKSSWRKPDEVVVSTDILADMRMYVHSNRPGSSSGGKEMVEVEF